MEFFKKIIKHHTFFSLLGIVTLLVFYAVLYKILIPRIAAFGCFDDCFNFMGGYFLLHNKKLFSEIFYNHAPLMAYISMLIQAVTHPQNLYELVLRHRQFVLLFGLVSEVLLVIRFGVIVVPFALFYELTKFYLFGDRFLAEGLVVYPLIYMLGVFIEQKVAKIKHGYDGIIAAFAAWFVIFMREPYALTAFALFSLLLLNIRRKRVVFFSFTIFLLVSAVTLFSHNVSEFIFNVWTVNAATQHVTLADLYKSFLYPLLLLFQNSWSFFGRIEFALAIIFLALSGYFLHRKHYMTIIAVWILLGLTNLRVVAPGNTYYGSFHMLAWYALFLASILFMLGYTWQKAKVFSLFMTIIFIATFLSIFTKGSYLHDKADEHTEFITNYGIPLQTGNVIAALSNPTDTLFLDGFDDIIYFVAHRYSQYQYSWYTSLMPSFSKYAQARITMFAKNPPDFYYGTCPKETRTAYMLPDFVQNDYIRLYNQQKPSCLWVKKSKLQSITPLQWEKAGEQLYYLEPHS